MYQPTVNTVNVYLCQLKSPGNHLSLCHSVAFTYSQTDTANPIKIAPDIPFSRGLRSFPNALGFRLPLFSFQFAVWRKAPDGKANTSMLVECNWSVIDMERVVQYKIQSILALGSFKHRLVLIHRAVLQCLWIIYSLFPGIIRKTRA